MSMSGSGEVKASDAKERISTSPENVACYLFDHDGSLPPPPPADFDDPRVITEEEIIAYREDFIESKVQEAVRAHVTLVLIGSISNRGTAARDNQNAKDHKNGKHIKTIHLLYLRFAEKLSQYGIRCERYEVLVTDIFENQPPGTHFKKALATVDKDINGLEEWQYGIYFFDSAKLIDSYPKLMELMKRFPATEGHKVCCELFDDKSEILACLNQFLSIEKLAPVGATIVLHQLTCADKLSKQSFPTIVGTGKLDYNYATNTKLLAQYCYNPFLDPLIAVNYVNTEAFDATGHKVVVKKASLHFSWQNIMSWFQLRSSQTDALTNFSLIFPTQLDHILPHLRPRLAILAPEPVQSVDLGSSDLTQQQAQQHAKEKYAKHVKLISHIEGGKDALSQDTLELLEDWYDEFIFPEYKPHQVTYTLYQAAHKAISECVAVPGTVSEAKKQASPAVVRVLALDYDGSFAPLVEDDRMITAKEVVEYRKPFVANEVKTAIAEGVTVIVLKNSSARGSLYYEILNAKHKNNGYFFQVLVELQIEFTQQLPPHIRCEVDFGLVTDIFSFDPPGTHFKKMLAVKVEDISLENYEDWVYGNLVGDAAKLLNTYDGTQSIAQRYPAREGHKIHYKVYDDRDDILSCQAWFCQQAGVVPRGMHFSLHTLRHDQPLATAYLRSPIVGVGEIDLDYRNSTLALVRTCGNPLLDPLLMINSDGPNGKAVVSSINQQNITRWLQARSISKSTSCFPFLLLPTTFEEILDLLLTRVAYLAPSPVDPRWLTTGGWAAVDAAYMQEQYEEYTAFRDHIIAIKEGKAVCSDETLKKLDAWHKQYIHPRQDNKLFRISIQVYNAAREMMRERVSKKTPQQDERKVTPPTTSVAVSSALVKKQLSSLPAPREAAVSGDPLRQIVQSVNAGEMALPPAQHAASTIERPQLPPVPGTVAVPNANTAVLVVRPPQRVQPSSSPRQQQPEQGEINEDGKHQIKARSRNWSNSTKVGMSLTAGATAGFSISAGMTWNSATVSVLGYAVNTKVFIGACTLGGAGLVLLCAYCINLRITGHSFFAPSAAESGVRIGEQHAANRIYTIL